MPIFESPERSPVRECFNGRILYVDCFDSFSNNIVGLLEQSLQVEVIVVRIDDQHVAKNLCDVLKSFDAVVVGPGPGHPANPQDVGFINQLWSLGNDDLLPIFGVCLGFQSLSLAHGAVIKKLNQPMHGIVSDILHNGTKLFEHITNFYATQYHSLHADIGLDAYNATTTWQSTEACPLLRPLAWAVSDENGAVLMAVEHTEKPFRGVQFHPESICTSQEGTRLMQNWWREAQDWLASRGRVRSNDARLYSTPIEDAAFATPDSEQSRNFFSHLLQSMKFKVESSPGLEIPRYQWTKRSIGSTTPVALCEALGLNTSEVIILDSQNHPSSRFSLLGIVIPNETFKVTYQSWSRTLSYGIAAQEQHAVQIDSIEQLWSLLQGILDEFDPRSASDTLPEDNPFWGGFMGYISYEAGLETIQVELHESCSSTPIPDINFAFIHRSVVVDHHTGEAYIQSLSSGDEPWILDVGSIIDRLSETSKHQAQPEESERHKEFHLERALKQTQITKPEELRYRDKVLRCQDFLRSGDSYELCLTDQTRIEVPRLDGQSIDAWTLYKRLRIMNPAPFGVFLRLSDAVVVGSSPERFLSWDRSGHCQLRPIKGTVKKGPHMTREKAHKILNSSKEQAENLMIVDLIRHDLSGIVGAANCKVSQLMKVEEYETVYQLVSVIEGQLQQYDGDGSPRGLDVLKASLPPGSMTGAPKKRSCEILREIEQRPRGIYSGVMGYLDVGGAGDFSVIIRTAVQGRKQDNDTTTNGFQNGHANKLETDTWYIGAGGAVTIQSSDLDEFHEMETKVTSALRAFQISS